MISDIYLSCEDFTALSEAVAVLLDAVTVELSAVCVVLPAVSVLSVELSSDSQKPSAALVVLSGSLKKIILKMLEICELQ